MLDPKKVIKSPKRQRRGFPELILAPSSGVHEALPRRGRRRNWRLLALFMFKYFIARGADVVIVSSLKAAATEIPSQPPPHRYNPDHLMTISHIKYSSRLSSSHPCIRVATAAATAEWRM